MPRWVTRGTPVNVILRSHFLLRQDLPIRCIRGLTALKAHVPANKKLFRLCEASHKWKKWLFTGSERAGKRAAAIQSLFATAKRDQLNPAARLTDVIEKLPAWPNSRIDELLPFADDRFSAAH